MNEYIKPEIEIIDLDLEQAILYESKKIIIWDDCYVDPDEEQL